MIVLLIIVGVGVLLLGGPWLVMITVGIGFHVWGWPSATLSLLESVPFALLLEGVVVGGSASRSA